MFHNSSLTKHSWLYASHRSTKNRRITYPTTTYKWVFCSCMLNLTENNFDFHLVPFLAFYKRLYFNKLIRGNVSDRQVLLCFIPKFVESFLFCRTLLLWQCAVCKDKLGYFWGSKLGSILIRTFTHKAELKDLNFILEGYCPMCHCPNARVPQLGQGCDGPLKLLKGFFLQFCFSCTLWFNVRLFFQDHLPMYVLHHKQAIIEPWSNLKVTAL